MVFNPGDGDTGDCTVNQDGFLTEPDGTLCDADQFVNDPTPTKPSCMRGLNPRDVLYVEENAASACDVAAEFGNAVSGGFILAWAAVESGFGTSSLASTNNMFFGEAFGVKCPNPRLQSFCLNTNPNRASSWNGSIPCSQLGSGANPGWACFATPGLAQSAYAALTARNGTYLLAAENNSGSFFEMGQAIADAGWCTTDPRCIKGGYGLQVELDWQELIPVLDCLFPNLKPR